MPKVFVPNESFHDFSKAERFGDFVFLTKGIVNKLDTNGITRLCVAALADAEPGDFVLVSSLPIITAIAASLLARRFGKVNFLIWDARGGFYVPRTIDFTREHQHAA